tara:strand:+ start:118 stop:354 length:237 start_codon:yes stop_codon:yes gene_type:complete
MNRKFIKENKSFLREFIADILSKILTGRAKKQVQNVIDKDPELQKKRKELFRLRKSVEDRMNRIKKSDPNLYNQLKQF